ncbi:MAG: LLM class flavin-dependent oxidoreductase, partial [Actinobacteria bacterium]|nr:LLM class flavin-dependent oxidoreductase [Actinomycetota bacterium]
MQLPVQALSSRVAMPWEAEGTVDDIVEVARACEGAGFLYVAACHHVAIPSEPAATMSTQWFDPIPTLAYVAAHTARTRLMTNVYVAPYRHPLESAKAFATLDALSSGRLIVGLGAGHVQGEFEALGVTFAQRGALMDEALDALLGALTDEWPVHDGKQWRYADVGQRPRPVQQPHP